MSLNPMKPHRSFGINRGIRIATFIFGSTSIILGTLSLALFREDINSMASTIVADPTSSSNHLEATVEHISLNWNVNFEKKRIEGSAKLNVVFTASTDKIALDGRSLEIKSVRVDDNETKFDIEEVNILGQKIVIPVGIRNKDDRVTLVIEYNTGEGCTALQFLGAEQTQDKRGPYLFSQCQAIHARSIVPCMDTPFVKQTYDAQVVVPKDLVCLMSAIAEGTPTTSGPTKIYSFKQSQRIPSYLLAIVVGVLESRNLSERIMVWSEPSIVEKAKFEFSDTEKMLSTAEELAGKYVWGRFDLLVLPSSFPLGGMENPCLTFLAPTLLAGDKSQVNVIAHEIAHSWTGNLVTNANWEHFWLNEGFTVFLERKIIGRLEGEPMRQFEAQTGWEGSLMRAIYERFNDQHPYTKLIPSLERVDPDDAFSNIPYEKGSALLMYIEQQIGDSEAFEEFFRNYIKKFAGKSIVTSDWKNFLYESFPNKKDVLDKIDWHNWFYDTGVPRSKPHYDDRLLRGARKLADMWLNANDSNLTSITASSFKSLPPIQQIKVLDCIHSAPALPHSKVKRLGEVYNLSASGNSEILYHWIMIGLKAHWKDIIPVALKFVSSQGRLKYVRPIYRELFDWTESAGPAIMNFQKNTPTMHPITVSVIHKLIPK